jgi:hypothetical protein
MGFEQQRLNVFLGGVLKRDTKIAVVMLKIQEDGKWLIISWGLSLTSNKVISLEHF